MSQLAQPPCQSPPPSEINWLWKPYIARGKITLLDGDPGFGKSLVTLDLAARLSRGLALPKYPGTPAPCRSLILSVEDEAGDTIWPRLRAAGADPAQIFVHDSAGGSIIPELPAVVPELNQRVRDLNIGLVVLDSLTTLLPAHLATGSPAAVRGVLVPLIQMAIETNAAVVLVRHLTKERHTRALYRGLGSIGVAGLARTILLAGPHPTDRTARALTVLKSNLANIPAPLSYRLADREGIGVVEWLDPAVSDVAVLDYAPARAAAPGVVRATVWLLEALANGPRPAVELLVAARADGISERVMEHAKKQLKVTSKLSHTKEGRRLWCWCPPGYGNKPFLPPLEFELEPLDDPCDEVLPDDLTPAAKALLDRDRLTWSKQVLNNIRR